MRAICNFGDLKMDLASLSKCLVSQLIASCLVQLVIGTASKWRLYIFRVLKPGHFEILGKCSNAKVLKQHQAMRSITCIIQVRLAQWNSSNLRRLGMRQSFWAFQFCIH